MAEKDKRKALNLKECDVENNALANQRHKWHKMGNKDINDLT